jgi:hypothetical protein
MAANRGSGTERANWGQRLPRHFPVINSGQFFTCRAAAPDAPGQVLAAAPGP